MLGSSWPLSRVVLLTAALLLTAGCGKDRSEHKYAIREGTALEIDAEGNVSMEFVNDKGIRMTGTGKVAADAEIWINGRQAAVSDVRPGDPIKVTLRIEGKKMNKTFIATKIEVEREEFESVGEPAATQPAETTDDTASAKS